MFVDVIKLLIEEHHAILLFSLEPILMYDVEWDEKVVNSDNHRKIVIGTNAYVSDKVKDLVLDGTVNVKSSSSQRCNAGSGEFESVQVTINNGNTYCGNYLVILSDIEEFKYYSFIVPKFKKLMFTHYFSIVDTDITKIPVLLVKSVLLQVDRSVNVKMWFNNEKWFKDNLRSNMLSDYKKIQEVKSGGYVFWDECDNQCFGIFDTIEEVVIESDKYFSGL
jgi:hypothetical protein